MNNDPNHTTAAPDSESMRATRRTVIRGVGVTGLLTIGVGTASAQEGQNEQPQAEEEEQVEQQSRGRGSRGEGPTLPSQASDRAKEQVDIRFPHDPGNGNGNDGIGA